MFAALIVFASILQPSYSIAAFCNKATSVVRPSTKDKLAKEWRGIVPLKSTRADVERLLGHCHTTKTGSARQSLN